MSAALSAKPVTEQGEQVLGDCFDGLDTYDVRSALVAKTTLLRVYCGGDLVLTITGVDTVNPEVAWKHPWRSASPPWKERLLFETYLIYYGCDRSASSQRVAVTKEIVR